jgi:hypothetical protein
MIDYEHLMDFEQLIRIELMIEKDMELAGVTYSDGDNWKEEIDRLNETDNIDYENDIPF